MSIQEEREWGAGDEMAGQGEDTLVHWSIGPVTVIRQLSWVVVVLASSQLYMFYGGARGEYLLPRGRV